ncbi:MAG: T9SS type A sorting domain-containing protein [Bacteroidetes bacterium]|nr:T9SS type A sorting domain-containing protein [Bacteroidota bacterium]
MYKVLATGNYRCAFIYSCDTIFSAPVFINDSTPPNVSLNSSIGTYYPYCNNKMFPQLSATSSTKNTLFKWYNNGILIDSSQSQYLNPSYGNDSIWHVVAVTACGTDTSLYAYYSLEPQQQTLACGMANDTAILCFNDSIEFCTGGTYWYLNGIYTNNVTLPLYISKPGTYKYEYTTGNCTTWSLPIYVIDKMNDSLKIKISPNDTVCNKKVTLNVMSPQANVLYTWYRNGLFFSTNDTVITGVSGNFHCEAFINGCDTLYSDTVYIQTDSVPAEIFKLNNFTNLCDADSIFLFDYNFDTNYVYAWKRVGNSFVYSNTYFYRPLAVGNYYFTKSSKTCVVISDTVQITSNNSNLNATITTTPSACSPCNGSATITANNPTNFNYLWSNSQTNQTAYNFCGGTYTVTVSVPGCSKSFNFMLGNSTPVSAIATTTTPSFGICDGTIAFNIIGGFAPYQTSLIPSAPLTALCQDVNYKATLTDNKGCTFVIDSAFYYKLSYDTIWPGDADNNGFVDNYDVVPLLLQDGRTGATRVDTTIAWHPIFPAYDWNGTKLYNNINCKHIDTDGNGIINIKDTAAITLNYDVTGKKNYNLQLNPQGPELYVTANASQFMPGNQVVLNYYAGTQSNPFYILRAFAAQTFIPKEVIEPGTFNLSSQNNFLTNFSFGYFFVKSDTNFQIDVAFGNYKYGFPNVYGELFTISFDVASSLSQVVNFAPAINNYTAHVSNELQIACSQSITPLTFLPVGIYETHLQDNIIIYPHPAKNEVSISSSNDIIKAIKIYNSSSKNVFSANSNSNRFTIQTENFPNGYYQIQIQLGNGNYANKKLIIIH